MSSPRYERVHALLEAVESLSHSRVEHNHRTGTVCLRAHGAEFEAVAGEREWRRTVAVGVVDEQFGYLRYVELQSLFARHVEQRLLVGVLDVFEQLAELVSEERRDDGRRCLVGSQTVGVCGAHDACLEQSVVTVDSHERLHDEHQEAQVVLWRLSRSVEQYARVGGEAPVVVLSRAVDARIRLLVEQHPEAVPARNLLHERHEQHVMVYRKVALLVYRSKLKLVRSHLVVAGLDRDSEFQRFDFQLLHKGCHTRRDAPK